MTPDVSDPTQPGSTAYDPHSERESNVGRDENVILDAGSGDDSGGQDHGETSDVDANPAAQEAPPRIAHLVLNDSFVERHEPAQVQGYIQTLVRASAQSDRDEEALEADIRDQMAAAGVMLPDESYRNLARQVRGSTGVAISTDSGRVLYGDPGLSSDVNDPDVRGSDDPEDEDRPFYS